MFPRIYCNTTRCKLKNIWRKAIIRKSSSGVIQYDKLNIGDIVHGYEVHRIVPVPDLFLTAVELTHQKTKCAHLHLDRNDDNNVFNISFCTTPMDDTGVAHILEHIALCGSQKFSVRDPFFKMINRSMSTFMNAMTGSDYTMYPFATQSSRDFKNLLSVYLDAVFFPNIRHLDFLQEGWRLEHTDPSDKHSPIVIKGVVYNEMKGLMTDPSYIFGTKMQQNILPDHTYGCCSGGDPFQIPHLTWENLKNFHATHYHPSNARVITYGNFPLQDHLQQINESLENFSSIDPDTAVPNQKRWTEEREVQITSCPNQMEDPNKQSTCAVCFMLENVENTYDNFSLFILSLLLTDGPNAPFYQSLIESGIGSTYAPESGFHNQQKDTLFSIGLQGICEEDIPRVKEIITSTVDDVVKTGFTKDHVEGVLHGVELRIKHQSSQFGLGLTFNTMPTWQHGTDPINALKINDLLNRFRNSLSESENYLQDLCEKYFKSNSHKLTLSMIPDQNFESDIKKQEDKLLQEKLQSLTDNDKKLIFENGEKLAKDQFSLPNLDCLPTLKVSDIQKVGRSYSFDVETLESNIQVASFVQPTNGITYFRAIRTLNNLPEDLVKYLPLFCSVFTEMGTKDTDYKQFKQKEDLYTGGLSANVHTSVCPNEPLAHEVGIEFSGHSLEHNVEAMFVLWEELMNNVNLRDGNRLQTLLREQAQEMSNSVPYNGHSYAMLESSSQLSAYRNLQETWDGLSQVKLLQGLAQQFDIDEVISKLNQIAAYIFQEAENEKTRCSIHSTATDNKRSLSMLKNFLSNVNLDCKLEEELTSDVLEANFAFSPQFHPITNDLSQHVIPMPVNFTAISINTNAPYESLDNAALKVLGKLLTSKYLLKEIREVGGAYGCGARQGSDGVFEMFSYRDPHSLETIKKFQDGISWVCSDQFTETDVDEAKLGIFQQLDTPVSPCNRGLTLFSHGITKDLKQSYRNKLLAISRKNILQATNKYLLNAQDMNVCIIGGENKEIKNDNKWSVKA